MAEFLGYDVVQDWEQIPDGYVHRDVVGVTVDSRDRVYLITRGDARVFVYHRDGSFIAAWGEDVFTPQTHGITAGPDDSIYTVDDGGHTVRKFTPEGEPLMVLGNSGRPSETGYDPKLGVASIKKGGAPFNRPTNLAVGGDGDLYISDGYGNARIHRFSPRGEYLGAWGEPGTGPGQFNVPHDIAVAPDGRLLVADRENDRIQIFSPDGEYLDEWPHVQRPTGIHIDADGLVYVSSLWWRIGQKSQRLGPIRFDLPGHVSILDLDGNLLLRWISADRCAPGNFCAPHDICADSHGDIYVAEASYSFAISKDLVSPECHTLQKFTPVLRKKSARNRSGGHPD